MQHNLTARYSCLLALYWAAFCALFSFFTAFLLWLGFSNTAAGAVVAFSNIGGVALQPFAASWAAKRPQGVHRMARGMTAALLAGSLLLLAVRRVPLAAAVLMALLGAVVYGLQGLLNALGMEQANAGARLDFGLARGFGSVGYACASFLLGQWTAKAGPTVLPWAYLALFVVMGLLLAAFPRSAPGQAAPAAPRRIGPFLRRYPRYTVLLAACVLLFLCYNLMMTYMIQIVRNLGGDTDVMGVVMGLGALVELPAMALVQRLLKRFSAGGLLCFSGVFLTVKALLIALAPSVAFLYLAQAVQPLSYAIFIPAGVYYTNAVLAPEDRVLGQTLMVMASALSSVFAGFLGGPLLDAFGVRVTALVAVGISAAGTAILLTCARRKTA